MLQVLAGPSLSGRLRQGLARSNGYRSVAQMATMPRRVGVPPWYSCQLPGSDAWPQHLEYFFVEVATTVYV